MRSAERLTGEVMASLRRAITLKDSSQRNMLESLGRWDGGECPWVAAEQDRLKISHVYSGAFEGGGGRAKM